jgi:hypothetical protein
MSLECACDSLSYPPYEQIARPVEGLSWHLFPRTPVEQALITGRKRINGTVDTNILFNDDTETSATAAQSPAARSPLQPKHHRKQRQTGPGRLGQPSQDCLRENHATVPMAGQ